MKTLDLLCASQAATATCTSLEHHVRSAATSQQNLKNISSKLSHGDQSIVKYNIHEKSSSDQVIKTKRFTSLIDAVRKSSCIRPSDYFTPGSQRYLLAENYQSHPLDLMETENVTDQKAGGKPDKGLIMENETPLSAPVSDMCSSPIVSNSNQVSSPFRIFKCVERYVCMCSLLSAWR